METLASRCIILPLLFLGVLLSVNQSGLRTVSAQDLDNVTITGCLTDQHGALIPGAYVEAVLVKTSAVRKVVADAGGRYHIVQLEPGVYNLRASSPGFAFLEKPELALIAGQNLQLDLTLLPEGVTVDPVVVTAADSPAVDTTRTVVGATVNTHEIESFPQRRVAAADLHCNKKSRAICAALLRRSEFP